MVGWLSSSVDSVGTLGVAPAPGCLKMPKLSDFLFGRMLHEMVLPAPTWIQRTR
ncbi:MAG: hypothetical protein INR71_01870 [Terriglobus roseus]|nr:hypothetical protein [Terriglobus roseus]